MTRTSQLIIFSLFLVTIASSQRIHLPKHSLDKILSSSQHSPLSTDNSMDLHYLDGCTAILEGLDDLRSHDKDAYSHSFAEWENLNPHVTLLNYFENNKGLVSKIYIESSYDDTWTMNIILYDGDYIDQKAAKIHIKIDNVENDTTLNQTNGSFTTNDSMKFTVHFGENLNHLKSQIDITGQVSISFVNTATNQPFSRFDQNATSVQGYSFQLNFTSCDGSFSFKTSVFTRTYTTPDETLVFFVVALALLIVALSSWYTRDLERKVSLGSLQASYASASFMSVWALTKSGILVIPASVNFLKFCIWICMRAFNPDTQSGSRFGLLIAVFAGVFSLIPTVWINLFPSLVLLFPFVQKVLNFEYNPYCLSRFEVSNFLYVLIWMGYSYLYPRNVYRYSNITLVSLTFGCILLQFMCLLIMQRIVSKRVSRALALLEDEFIMSNQNLNDQQAIRS